MHIITEIQKTVLVARWILINLKSHKDEGASASDLRSVGMAADGTERDCKVVIEALAVLGAIEPFGGQTRARRYKITNVGEKLLEFYTS